MNPTTTTPTYERVAFSDLRERDTVRLTHTESGSVLVGKALGVIPTATRLSGAPVSSGEVFSASHGWTVEREIDLSHVPTVPGRYMRESKVRSLYNGEAIYNYDGFAFYEITRQNRTQLVQPKDLPRDLVRLVASNVQREPLDSLLDAPEGYYRDKDGDHWRVFLKNGDRYRALTCASTNVATYLDADLGILLTHGEPAYAPFTPVSREDLPA